MATPGPEQSTSNARLEKGRPVDSEIIIDMNKDLVGVYPEATIRTAQYTGELVAEAVIDGDDAGAIGIFRGEDRKGRPMTIALEGNSNGYRVLKPEKRVPVGGIAVMAAADLSTLVLTKLNRRTDVRVSANIYPGPEPFEKTY